MKPTRIIRTVVAAAVLGTMFAASGASAGTANLIEYASTWRVLDNGTNQTPSALPSAAHFGSPSYVESSTWRSETIAVDKVLGYGDNARVSFPTQVPNLSFGPTSGSKYITTYFRSTFTVVDAASVTSLVLNVRRDDGVIVYVNGVEVARSNIAAGATTYTTFAPTIIDGVNEYTPVALNIATTGLVTGPNLLAIELHQRDGTSSDITFAAQLVATTLDAEIPEAPLTVLMPLVAAAGVGGAVVVQRRRTARS